MFEYLLGNILSVFKERGKGQLLFTSHNLRALEVIKDNIPSIKLLEKCGFKEEGLIRSKYYINNNSI